MNQESLYMSLTKHQMKRTNFNPLIAAMQVSLSLKRQRYKFAKRCINFNLPLGRFWRHLNLLSRQIWSSLGQSIEQRNISRTRHTNSLGTNDFKEQKSSELCKCRHPWDKAAMILESSLIEIAKFDYTRLRSIFYTCRSCSCYTLYKKCASNMAQKNLRNVKLRQKARN